MHNRAGPALTLRIGGRSDPEPLSGRIMAPLLIVLTLSTTIAVFPPKLEANPDLRGWNVVCHEETPFLVADCFEAVRVR